MKNKELFDRTISILVKAYFDNTLDCCACTACAVGNLVAANNGVILKNTGFCIENINMPDFYTGLWFEPMLPGRGKNAILYSRVTEEVNKQIESTGYSIEDLADIERAFYIGVGDMVPNTDYNFEGLMEVVDCLSKIHEADEKEIEQAKSLFTKELTV